MTMDAKDAKSTSPASCREETPCRLGPGAILRSQYTILRVAASTEMNTVYLAHDQRTGRMVAIKQLTATRADDRSYKVALRCMRREAGFLSELAHPQIPRLRATFRDESNSYLVMDYIDGQTVEALLEHRAITRRRAVEIMDRLCDVVAYLHDREMPIIHADIKPGNILITPDGEVALLDFGLARYRGERVAMLTSVGTPGFASAEQWRGAALDERSDVYALGMLLKTLWGESPRSVAIAAVMERASAAAAKQRFANVAAFRRALRRAATPLNARPSAMQMLVYYLPVATSIMMLVAIVALSFAIVLTQISAIH